MTEPTKGRGKGFTRKIVTKEQLADITASQIRTVPIEPVIVAEPAAPAAEGKRGRPKRIVEMVTFNLRLPAEVIEQIDGDRGALYSRNAWIAEAIAAKLKRTK